MHQTPIRGGRKAIRNAKSITPDIHLANETDQSRQSLSTLSDSSVGPEHDPSTEEPAILFRPRLTWVPL